MRVYLFFDSGGPEEWDGFWEDKIELDISDFELDRRREEIRQLLAECYTKIYCHNCRPNFADEVDDDAPNFD